MAPLLGLLGMGGGNSQVKGEWSDPISASGGSTFPYGGKKIHKFTGPGNFVIASGSGDPVTVEVVVVAGGAGGGAYRGAGGGAGGVAIAPEMPFAPGTFAVAVGGGGAAGAKPGVPFPVGDGADGGDSTLTNGSQTVTAKGGGGGAAGNSTGHGGGCGGGKV